MLMSTISTISRASEHFIYISDKFILNISFGKVHANLKDEWLFTDYSNSATWVSSGQFVLNLYKIKNHDGASPRDRECTSSSRKNSTWTQTKLNHPLKRLWPFSIPSSSVASFQFSPKNCEIYQAVWFSTINKRKLFHFTPDSAADLARCRAAEEKKTFVG